MIPATKASTDLCGGLLRLPYTQDWKLNLERTLKNSRVSSICGQDRSILIKKQRRATSCRDCLDRYKKEGIVAGRILELSKGSVNPELDPSGQRHSATAIFSDNCHLHVPGKPDNLLDQVSAEHCRQILPPIA